VAESENDLELDLKVGIGISVSQHILPMRQDEYQRDYNEKSFLSDAVSSSNEVDDAILSTLYRNRSRILDIDVDDHKIRQNKLYQ
jgi:hypothetical protein